jgi:molybdopterin molybdotransferase
MIPISIAESVLLSLVNPLKTQEVIPLAQARDRILATEITSELDFPHFDNSAMDGYAVRFEDVTKPGIELTVVTTIPAGQISDRSIQPGEAARIFTGAVMPTGADTIIMQEHTQIRENSDQVMINQLPKTLGQFVRRRGTFYQRGQTLLKPGLRIGPGELAVLAAAQITQVPVLRRPKVAIFSTGDELITPQESLTPGKIVDSNSYGIGAWLAQLGVEVTNYGILRDDPNLITATMENGMVSHDAMISTGGVSVGDYDYIGQILANLGGTIHFNQVQIKPGKPLTVATFKQSPCLYCGVPGNPVSALVTCWRLVQPALNKMMGLPEPQWLPKILTMETMAELSADGQRETYLWGNAHVVDGKYQFQLVAGAHNSANLINLAGINALAIMPVGTKHISSHQSVAVMVLS